MKDLDDNLVQMICEFLCRATNASSLLDTNDVDEDEKDDSDSLEEGEEDEGEMAKDDEDEDDEGPLTDGDLKCGC